mgnify:CR=1 FL=1
MTTLLALDTATEACSVALLHNGEVISHYDVIPRLHAQRLLPMIQQLLAESGVSLNALDAIAFGRGPGAFTGLRTACSVAQGLAFGADLLVLPIDTLLAVAEEARFSSDTSQIQAVLDARMGEVYAASYAYNEGVWNTHSDIQLCKPDQLQFEAGFRLAGNCLDDAHRIQALPTATAMLRLAPAMLAAGLGVPADQALPLYVRDKVAQTTAERAALKLNVPVTN